MPPETHFQTVLHSPGKVLVYSLSIVYLFEAIKDKKAKDRKPRADGLLGKFQQQTTDKITPPETDRSYREI